MKILSGIMFCAVVTSLIALLLAAIGVFSGNIIITPAETEVLHEGTVSSVERSATGLFGTSQITVTFKDGYQFYSGSYMNHEIYGDIYIGGYCKIFLSNKQSTGNFALAKLCFSR